MHCQTTVPDSSRTALVLSLDRWIRWFIFAKSASCSCFRRSTDLRCSSYLALQRFTRMSSSSGNFKSNTSSNSCCVTLRPRQNVYPLFTFGDFCDCDFRYFYSDSTFQNVLRPLRPILPPSPCPILPSRHRHRPHQGGQAFTSLQKHSQRTSLAPQREPQLLQALHLGLVGFQSPKAKRGAKALEQIFLYGTMFATRNKCIASSNKCLTTSNN